MSLLRRWTFYAGLVFPAFLVVSFYLIEATWPMLVWSWWPWVVLFAVLCLASVAGFWKRNRPFAVGVLIATPLTAMATAALLIWAFGQKIVS